MNVKEVNELEVLLRGLIKGKFSSLGIHLNEEGAPNYKTVAEIESPEWGEHRFDWISEEERQKAIETNSMWTIQWYPDHPNTFYAYAASSLWALIEYLQSPPKED